jgi:hypothetical protein
MRSYNPTAATDPAKVARNVRRAIWDSPERVDTVNLLPWWRSACARSRSVSASRSRPRSGIGRGRGTRRRCRCRQRPRSTSMLLLSSQGPTLARRRPPRHTGPPARRDRATSTCRSDTHKLSAVAVRVPIHSIDAGVRLYRRNINRHHISGPRCRVYGTGIGASELPAAIDEQFCGAATPSKRCLIQAIEFVSQITMLETWPSKSYCS